MDIFTIVEQLLCFGVRTGLIDELDIITTRNGLYDLLKLSPDVHFQFGQSTQIDHLDTPYPILEQILDYCVENAIIENTTTSRDLMDARIMGLFTARESEVTKIFSVHYGDSPEKATNYFYKMCQSNNYIQMGRIAKNKYWTTETDFGVLEVTVNLSKPEKDPREIAAAKNVAPSAYPKCLLCMENIGFCGNLRHPARQNLRVIPLALADEDWFFQYSPYVYYNEHCIVVNKKHVPMKISEATFHKLLTFLDFLPHYFIGANADLPIVGGSILSHDHFQGGRHVFPMETAQTYASYAHEKYPGIDISLVKWPLSAIRIAGSDKKLLIALAMEFLNHWRAYEDKQADIVAFTQQQGITEPHNTITPIARINAKGQFELDLVLRNNRTSEEHPMGIFHPHANLHHIKKENIGLIEVMGLAVLPGRLSKELEEIAAHLTDKTLGIAPLQNADHPLHIHAHWVSYLFEKYGFMKTEDVHDVLQKEVGLVFENVLKDAGVFKTDAAGKACFAKFMVSTGCVLI